MIDEIRDHDEIAINEVVLPLMNVSRRLPSKEVNPKEPNQQTICMTSAGVKTSFAYDKLIDMFENAVIDPNYSFVFGCDYRIPVLHGLLDRNYINQLKMSPSYNENSFAREYMSIWSGSSEESWFSFDKLSKYRKLKNPEERAYYRVDSEQFYLLSVDVGRISDQTVCTVFKINVVKNRYYATVVNIYVLGRTAKSKLFTAQAIDLKRLIKAFNPREVVIDTNGLGVGIADEMIKGQTDELGNFYPAYGFTNDDEYKKTQPREAINILFGIKANSSLNSQINGNVYTRLSGGLCRFLIEEREAKNNILSTKVGQKMTIEQRTMRLMPHQMTNRLMDEMANLRLKKTASMDIVLERINSRFPKDKYSSFSYGLWRIKELEEEWLKKKNRRNGGGRKMVFFSGGN